MFTLSRSLRELSPNKRAVSSRILRVWASVYVRRNATTTKFCQTEHRYKRKCDYNNDNIIFDRRILSAEMGMINDHAILSASSLQLKGTTQK